MNKSIEDLQPKTQDMVRAFLNMCASKGIKVGISEGLRTAETQAVYYLRGRIDVSDKKIREALKILGAAHAWKFSSAECEQKVTWTLESNHLTGNAVDIVVYDDNFKPDWNSKGTRWQDVLAIARNCGFPCGADWEQNDYPHLENLNKQV